MVMFRRIIVISILMFLSVRIVVFVRMMIGLLLWFCWGEEERKYSLSWWNRVLASRGLVNDP